MKIIDLLNKIAKGKKVPKHIKYLNLIWEYDDEIKDYINDDTYLIYSLNAFGLNNEIEIIEEPKKIEKLDITLETTANGNLHNYLMHDGDKYAVSMPYRVLNDKLDEIIDYINSKENNNE